MTLAALIRKRPVAKDANANPANAANDKKGESEPLAKLAALALANTTEAQAGQASPMKSKADMVTVSRWWLVHYPNRNPMKSVSSSPGATRAEILAWHPGAVAAEPFEPVPRQASEPMAGKDETAIMAWLARIGETDADIIADVLNHCRLNADSRRQIVALQKESNHANH